jgi:hypothetical protein
VSSVALREKDAPIIAIRPGAPVPRLGRPGQAGRGSETGRSGSEAGVTDRLGEGGHKHRHAELTHVSGLLDEPDPRPLGGSNDPAHRALGVDPSPASVPEIRAVSPTVPPGKVLPRGAPSLSFVGVDSEVSSKAPDCGLGQLEAAGGAEPGAHSLSTGLV